MDLRNRTSYEIIVVQKRRLVFVDDKVPGIKLLVRRSLDLYGHLFQFYYWSEVLRDTRFLSVRSLLSVMVNNS